MKRSYQIDFVKNWFWSSLVTWPVAIMIGKHYKQTWGGVPLVPIQRIIHDFVDVSATNTARRQMRFYTFGSAMAMGFVIAIAVTDRSTFTSDSYKNNPTLRPYAAMVKPDEDDITYKTMLPALYTKHRTGQYKSSAWYRFLFPADADFTVKDNPYRKYSHNEVFSTQNRRYSSYNEYADHHA